MLILVDSACVRANILLLIALQPRHGIAQHATETTELPAAGLPMGHILTCMCGTGERFATTCVLSITGVDLFAPLSILCWTPYGNGTLGRSLLVDYEGRKEGRK